jgi:hypothetical protein
MTTFLRSSPCFTLATEPCAIAPIRRKVDSQLCSGRSQRPVPAPNRLFGTTTSPMKWRNNCGHVDAALIWCNPIQDGHRRDRLDALLREVARSGVLVSTHPKCDVYEHAFYVDYQSKKPDYIKNFVQFIDWMEAGTRYSKLA